jgi:RAP1 GTPase activating protein 1
MVESPSSHRINSNGNQSTISYTKPINEYTWCYENSIPIHTNIDECLPQLEIDDKPLIYRQQFQTTEHFNWYGYSENYGPAIISYKHSIDQNKQRLVVSIVRTRQRTSVETLYNVHSSSTPIEILRRICEQCGIQDIEYFDPVLCDGTHDLLLKYDESHVSNQHKFGVIYQRENQVTEEDIFSNETHSNTMEEFLDLIGTRVKLKDFRGFRGGLDVKSDQTGTESVYEQFQNHELMFHVSTLLPHSKSERQQLERKRHIGNDIVAIVFQETETIFNPECIASQFLHVYIVITPIRNNNDQTQFKVSIIYRDTVPSFGPNLPHSNLFHCDHIFKQWLLTKLINAELASCRASTIQKYHERTKMSLFDNLYRTLHESNRPLMNLMLFHSQYKHECDIEQQQQQREEALKTSDRHADSSLLGSVRIQNPTNENNKSSPSATIIITTPPSSNNNNNNDSRSKTRSMTMDLRRSASRESINTNGHTTTNGNHSNKMTSFFSSSKSNTPRLDKSTTSRSLLDHENIDSISSSRSHTKFLSPATCPSSPWTSGPANGFVTSSSSNELNHNGDSYSHSTSMLNSSFNFNTKLLPDEIDTDPQINLSPDDLQSSSKDDLIKFILALQQHHSTKFAQIHSNALKRIETRQQDSP